MADPGVEAIQAAQEAAAKVRKAQQAIDESVAKIRQAQKKFEDTKVRLEKLKEKAEKATAKAKAAKQRIKDRKSAFKPKMVKIAGLAGMIAVLIGIMKAQLILKIQEEVFKLLDKFAQQCPNPKDLRKAIKIKNNLLRNINSFQKRIDKFAKVASTLLKVALVLKKVIKVITSIPFPTAVPPGIGIPASLLTKFSNVIVKVSKLIDTFIAEAAAILLIIKGISDVINRLKEKLQELDSKIERCAKNPLADPNSDTPVEPEITSLAQLAALTPEQLAELTPDQLAGISADQLAALTSSQLSETQQSGLSLTDLTPEQISGLTPLEISQLTPEQISELTSDQLSGVSANQFSTLSLEQLPGLTSDQLSGLTLSQLPGLSRSELSSTQISQLTSDQLAALSKGNPSGRSSAELSGLSAVQLAALTRDQPSGLSSTQLSQLSADQLAALSKSKLTPAQQSALTTKVIVNTAQPKENTGSEGAPTDAAGNSDPNYSHKSITTGKLYTLSIVQDPNSPKIAPRRYAIAKDMGGTIRLKGDSSFSSSTQVLLDEIKFKIDNQLL